MSLTFHSTQTVELPKGSAPPAEVRYYLGLLNIDSSSCNWNHKSNVKGARWASSLRQVRFMVVDIVEGITLYELRREAGLELEEGEMFAGHQEMLRALILARTKMRSVLPTRQYSVYGFGGVVCYGGAREFSSRMVPSARLSTHSGQVTSDSFLTNAVKGVKIVLPVVKRV